MSLYCYMRSLRNYKKAVSAFENISASGRKISLQGKTENASSNVGNVYGMSETSGRLAWRSYKTLVCYKTL